MNRRSPASLLATLFDRPVRVEPPPPADPEPAGLMQRRWLLERIMELNRSARPGFLERFSDADLAAYLEHLTAAQEPRGPSARWRRREDEPAIVAHSRRE